MVEISEDLRDLVTSTIKSIKDGLKEEKCGVSGTIKFEVSVVKSKEGKTGFNVVVADASGAYTKDNTSKISFEIAGVLTESEKADLVKQINQLQREFGASNSKVEQLAKQVQTLNGTIDDQKLTIKQDHEKIEELRDQKNN
jgi:peptidoglycan hydrolase CwlO-like protein